MKKIVLLLTVVLLPILATAQEQDLNVLNRWMEFSDVENSLSHYYADITSNDLSKREKEISELKTKADWEARQERVKAKFSKVIGEFPKKTPLNANVTGVLKRDKFRVEKIIFESQPQYYVTAAMYIPNNLEGKAPAILYTCGHAGLGFRSPVYQKVCINLVRKGFVVLAIDPVSQGERMQYLDTVSNKSLVGSGSGEHAYEGGQCFMIGSSLAKYMIWDGIRAVDYLVSRPEVDANRIGVTGRSGGGTQSSYIAAFDNRIKVVAPENYITNFKRLWNTIGPQDAEQIFYHGTANGLDHADLLEVRAPKPALHITTTRDFFSIQGARETEKEVKKVYKVFNAEDNYYKVEDDAEHASTKKNREALYSFLQKHLNLPGSSRDEDVKVFTPEELNVTKTGQVLSSLGGETVFSLNKKETKKILSRRAIFTKNGSTNVGAIVESAKTITGYTKPQAIETAVSTGQYKNDRYSVKKFFIKGETGAPIPFLLFLPNKVVASPILYLNPKGKSSNLEEVEWLIKYGHPVLAADLVGFGELKQESPSWTKYRSGYGEISDPHWGGPVMTGKSTVSIHAADIQRLVLFLKFQSGINAKNIIGIAKGDLCPALVHAAAFEKEFSKVALVEPLVSYASVVENRFYKVTQMFPFIPGVLMKYDLPDIEATLAPNKLLILNTQDQLGKGLSNKLVDKKLTIVRRAYENYAISENMEIKRIEKNENIFDCYAAWLK